MRVLYDGQMFCMQKAGGINRYFTELINRLPAEFKPEILMGKKESDIFPKREGLAIRKYPFCCSWPSAIWGRFEPFYHNMQTRLFSGGVFHPTFYKTLTKKKFIKEKCPMVITVWDMLHIHYPKWLDPDGCWGEQINRSILAADALICISNNTKKELLEYYKVNPERVFVSPLAGCLDESMAPKNFTVEHPFSKGSYFLFVGGRAGYKNFSVLISAFKLLLETNKDLNLCVAGEIFSDAEKKELQSAGLEKNIIHFHHPNDAVLAALYKHAVALVYPSSHEGFGLPVLEAMNCGTTVIASNCSSLPEVAGDAAILIEPENKEDLLAAMQLLLNNSAARENLLKLAIKRRAIFSWDTTAKSTSDIYKSLV